MRKKQQANKKNSYSRALDEAKCSYINQQKMIKTKRNFILAFFDSFCF